MGGLVGAASEGFVNHHKAEGARAHRAPFEPELVGQAGSEDGVGELFLLAARLAARVGVMLMLAVVLAPALAGGKHKAVAHIGDLGAPATVLFGLAFTPAKVLDDLLARPY